MSFIFCCYISHNCCSVVFFTQCGISVSLYTEANVFWEFRKKAEQAPAREAIKEERKKEFDVGGVLGQRGGVVNPDSAK